MWQIIDENCEKFVHSQVHIFYTWISCIENTLDTQINVLMDEIQIYDWTNVKYVFNAQYQCVKCTNYEYIFFARFPLLSHEMLNLWWRAQKNTPREAIFIFLNVRKDIEGWLLNHEWSQGCKETWKGCSKTIYFGH
jgi:tRNA U38,U39,U40 pseudouridine synthase TruA